MKIFYTEHAESRLVERKIPIDKIEQMLRKGIHFQDVQGKNLCVYRESAHEFFTFVYSRKKKNVVLITAYPSKNWEVREFKERCRK